MNIVIGEENIQDLDEKYTILELDTFKLPGDSQDPVKTYCVIETVPIEEIPRIDEFRSLHAKLIENYRRKNWKFCEDALEHLQGRWKGELDTFYVDLSRRIDGYKITDPGQDWDGVYDKTKQ